MCFNKRTLSFPSASLMMFSELRRVYSIESHRGTKQSQLSYLRRNHSIDGTKNDPGCYYFESTHACNQVCEGMCSPAASTSMKHNLLPSSLLGRRLGIR